MNTGEVVLSVEGVTAGYDKADVLKSVSIDVLRGTVTCLLGANGAGKSTLIRTIFGLVKPRAGRIRFGGGDITGGEPHRIVAAGLACIPEGNRVFPKLSVRENLVVGAYLQPARALAERQDEVLELFPALRNRLDQYAGTLSGGERSMLCIGRCLMGAPDVLVIDEPSLGLSPLLVRQSFEIVQRLSRSGKTILLVEQNVNQTLEVSHRGFVMAQGRIAAAGSADQLRGNGEVAKAYFGAH